MYLYNKGGFSFLKINLNMKQKLNYAFQITPFTFVSHVAIFMTSQDTMQTCQQWCPH